MLSQSDNRRAAVAVAARALNVTQRDVNGGLRVARLHAQVQVDNGAATGRFSGRRAPNTARAAGSGRRLLRQPAWRTVYRMPPVHCRERTVWWKGNGPNVLLGGSNRTVALQPSSLQGSITLNVVAGLSLLKLRPLPM